MQLHAVFEQAGCEETQTCLADALAMYMVCS